MKYYKVSAVNITRDGYVVLKNEDGSAKVLDEVVDTDNLFFQNCNDEFDVEDAYEAFWNRLNDNYLNPEIVKVLKVEEISMTEAIKEREVA